MLAPAGIAVGMFPCPSCRKTLPPSAATCQFCGANVGKVPRQRDPSDITGHGVKKEYVWTMYFLLSAFWLAGAAWTILDVLVITPNQMGAKFEGHGVIEYAIAGFGGIRAIIALGLLFKVELVRAVVNFFAFLGLAIAFFELIGSLLNIAIFGPIGLVFVILAILDMAINAGIMWVIGETDSRTMG